MKKRTLSVLLIIPFLVSLMTFISVKILDNAVAVDILGIQWKYDENEGFQINEEEPYLLEAEPILPEEGILANGSADLVWSLQKINADDQDYAEITSDGKGNYYLSALQEGSVEVVCSNKRKTVSKHFTATIFEDGAMIINPVRKGSGSNIDRTKYYGAYDLSYTKAEYGASYAKNPAQFELVTKAFGPDGTVSDKNVMIDSSDNISYQNGVVTIHSPNPDSYITLQDPISNAYATYSFNAVNGVNIYNYNDLLMATNFSADGGENVVMQVNLESLNHIYQQEKDETGKPNGVFTQERLPNVSDNTELFGNFDFGKQEFSFKKEYYTFETTYDSSFIDYYNKETGENVSKVVVAGIHLNKNLYGNGFTINMNGLCFPNHGEYDKYTQKLVPNKEKDFFFGPVPFVIIRGGEDLPLIEALGQDNCGFYIDNDNVVVNDIKISNVNQVNNLFDLSYTGTVVDVKGDNVIIKNSILADGKVALRAYDADSLLIDNSILKNSGEYNLLVGSDDKLSPDTTKHIKDTFNGVEVDKSFAEFFADPYAPNFDKKDPATADAILNASLKDMGSATSRENLLKIQSLLDNSKGLINSNGQVQRYASEIKVKDTFFGRSGVFSIASESYFNGPFLYNGLPSMLGDLLAQYLDTPIPQKLGGTSLPVHLTLEGDTRFYDWKDVDSIDVSSLIIENISKILASLGGDFAEMDITIDDIFPMKKILKQEAEEKGLIYHKNDKNYINTSMAYYGGGLNLSYIENNSEGKMNTFSDMLSINLMDQMLSSGDQMSSILISAVLITIGTHPFRFIINGQEEALDPIIPDDNTEEGNEHDDGFAQPPIEDLKQNANRK